MNREENLEQIVAERTAELLKTNEQLQQEIDFYQDLEEELRANQQALQLSQERIDSILGSIEDVVWSLAPHTYQILYINTATEKVFDRSIIEFIQNLNLWQEIIHPEDRERVEQADRALYTTGKQDIEYRILWKNGEVRWVRVRSRLVCDADGNPLRVDGITTDITERQRIQEQLRFDALHDGLTGLANRNLLLDRLEQTIKRSQRQDSKPFAVLFLDLDSFKVINDSLGHQIGDRLLMAVAHRLEKCQRSEDTVARLGGDEFVILLEEIEDLDDAMTAVKRIQQALKPVMLLDRHEIFVTASIGVAMGDPQIYTSPDRSTDLLRDADTAMYRAKALKQGGCAIFEPSMHAYAVKRMQVENDLRRAIDRMLFPELYSPEFLVFYQPIVSLSSDCIRGFEALVRWQHPEKGTISPAEFMPIAEETGLAIDIDRWVLERACRQLQIWQQEFPNLLPLTMNVNLSGKHFSQSGLIEFIDLVLQETGIAASSLKLEITETVVIENAEAATVMLRELRERNIHVCLDDFGTGYSSLSYLHCFPFNTLKIDRSFVKQLGIKLPKEDNNEIVKAIINLGLTLGMSVVAEGVETKEQLALLKTLNCHFGQGYWFSKPIDETMMTDFLRASQLSQKIE